MPDLGPILSRLQNLLVKSMHLNWYFCMFLSQLQIIFFKINSLINFFQSNSLNPDQALRFVGPDLGPNCCKGYQQMTKFVTSQVKR